LQDSDTDTNGIYICRFAFIEEGCREGVRPYILQIKNFVDPYIGLCLAVLALARADSGRIDTPIWWDFKAEHDMGTTNYSAEEVAHWVADWMTENLKGQ